VGFSSLINEKDDFATGIRLFGGFTTGRWVLASAANLEGRHMVSSSSGNRWRDVLGELDVYTYWQPEAIPRHTLFARVSGAGGWSMTGPFQLTLGGSTGLRGYAIDRLPGGRRVTASLEDRVYLASPASGMFDLGLTAFVDVGSIWQGEAPFGFDSGFLASGGLGLRIGFPGGTRGVIRVDVATPLNGRDAFSGPTFRITASELLGLLQGFEDPQLRRSRRARVGVGILPDPSSGR
jgi:hemolysin activation/secretion protein